MSNRPPLPFILLLFLTFILSAPLAGCGSEKERPRDFNELIPRMMGAIHHNNSPAQAAANLFNVTSPDERRDAIAYLETKKYGHEPPYMKAYELLTTDPNAMVRAQAMRALGDSRNNAITPWLINGTTGRTGMADPDAEVRVAAAQSFLKVFTNAAVPVVINHLATDPDDQVRVACARALQNTTKPESFLALIKALDDKNAAVVYWAHEALMTKTGNSYDYDPQLWLTWYNATYGQPTPKPTPHS